MTGGYDAVVLAGGRSARMQVPDKTALLVREQPMLDRVLAAVSAAVSRVVVGSPRPTLVPVEWTCEQPPGDGPVAAAAAGLALGRAPYVALLAGDLPLLDVQHVEVLFDTLVDDDDADGAVYVDSDGRPQWLCAMWRRGPVVAATEVRAGSLQAAFRDLRVTAVADTECGRPGWLDCDTPNDLRRAETLLT